MGWPSEKVPLAFNPDQVALMVYALCTPAADFMNGATVDEIAAAAGVNKQRIYAYFGSKNGLFEAVLRDVFERVELFSRETVAKAARSPEKITEIMVT